MVVFLSGGMTKQQLWEDIGFSRTTWFNYPKGTVPFNRISNAVENKYPGTGQILNANLWKILKGKKYQFRIFKRSFRTLILI